MKVKVLPGELTGSIEAAPSKSAMQRACALALLAHGTSRITNAGYSNDDKAAIGVISALGAKVNELPNNEIEITSNGVENAGNEIYCGESGLGIRMFTPIAAISDKEIRITGSGSLTTRPMSFFDEIFPQLGIAIQTNEGKLPIKIKGPLQPSDITIDGSLSSQFLTGLLFAFAATNKQEAVITVNGLKSRPYIDLSLEMLKMAGVTLVNKDYREFHFQKNSGSISPFHYKVEGDWSGAAFLLVSGAINGKVTVSGLNIQSAQADKAIIEALKSAGAKMQLFQNEIKVETSALQAFEFDATDCPDLFPPLAALAAYSKGITKIKGVLRLTHKESHRGLTIQQELGKLGVKVALEGDMMIIEGSNSILGGKVDSHNDHRIAMMAAITALKAKSAVTVLNASAINKSYPAFYEHLQLLGIEIIYEQN